jgi:hypothetical protein
MLLNLQDSAAGMTQNEGLCSLTARRRLDEGSQRGVADDRAPRQWRDLPENALAHILDRGGMRRAWLRGRENIHKR